MVNTLKTSFSEIYDAFLSKITDDMYMELSPQETQEMMQELLLGAIPWFEFPRKNLSDYEIEYVQDETIYQGIESDDKEVRAFIIGGGTFAQTLTQEEINILAVYMVVEWIGQQLASIENTRMKYSGTDFKFTSQANHLGKLITLKKEYKQQGFHLQRLYKRRKINEDGEVVSTMNEIVEEY